MPGGGFNDDQSFTKRRGSASRNINSSRIDPLVQAAQIQADALGEAIPLFDPFMEAGLQGLDQFQDTSTPEGLDAILARIMGGDAFGSLKEERVRDIEGLLGAGGLTRSGTAVEAGENLSPNLALELEGILSGRSGGLADTGFAATSNIADLTTRIGEAIASGILGVESRDNARDASRDTNRSNIIGAALGGLLGGGKLFSDPLLKKNTNKKYDVGPLGYYEWDWVEGTKNTIVETMPTNGFLSTEVKEHFPDFVGEFGGFDIINYKGLINHLRTVCHY